MGKYLVQKAADYEGQSAKWKKLHPSLDALAYSHIGMKKYDGCHLIVQTYADGSTQARSRTGEVVRSCAHIEQAVLRVFGEGWVVFGEAWHPSAKFPEISGKFRSHSPQDDLVFVPFDIVRAQAYDEGQDDYAFRHRLAHIMLAILHNEYVGMPIVTPDYFNPGTFIKPQELANSLVANGGSDGLILRDPDASWILGSAKEGEIIKVKPVMSFDLRVIGVEEGQGKMAGMAGALIVSYKGKPCRASGGSFDDRRTWLATADIMPGRIAEIECLGITEDGLLREPRVKGIRYDKFKPDA